MSSIAIGGIFISLLKYFKTPQCQFCTEMSDLCYLRKLILLRGCALRVMSVPRFKAGLDPSFDKFSI